MIDPADIKTRFPEFFAISDARIQLFLDDAIEILNSVYWGEKYDLGLSYLTAHYIALAEKSSAGSITASATSGPISGKSVDGTSLSYSSITPDDVDESYYLSTAYGQRYLQLRKNIGVPACVI